MRRRLTQRLQAAALRTRRRTRSTTARSAEQAPLPVGGVPHRTGDVVTVVPPRPVSGR